MNEFEANPVMLGFIVLFFLSFDDQGQQILIEAARELAAKGYL